MMEMNFQKTAEEILQLCKNFNKTAIQVKNEHFIRLEKKQTTPLASMLFNDYFSNFWRIIKHIKSIALAEQHPQFWIKREKLDNIMSDTAPGYAVPADINPDDYLDRLQSEDYI